MPSELPQWRFERSLRSPPVATPRGLALPLRTGTPTVHVLQNPQHLDLSPAERHRGERIPSTIGGLTVRLHVLEISP